jgi:hypothetical protein
MNKHASGAGFNTAMVHQESLNGNSNDKNGKVDPQARQGEWPISEERQKNALDPKKAIAAEARKKGKL